MTLVEPQLRLEGVFRTVFAELQSADVTTVKSFSKTNANGWDSATHLLLLTCLEEEFGQTIADAEAGSIDSFAMALAIVC